MSAIFSREDGHAAMITRRWSYGKGDTNGHTMAAGSGIVAKPL
jgi:hypothetical protein